MQLQDNYPLKNITTLNIGGPAKKFIKVQTEEELVEAIKYAQDNQMPYLVIGGGSNLLVSDEGIDCIVIKNSITGISTSKVGLLVPSEAEGDSFEVCVKSGTSLQDFVNFTIQKGISGLQKLTGIPGTVGGAVYGNAGAYGQSISNFLVGVTVFDGEKIITFSKMDCQFNYRDSIFKKNKCVILEAKFLLQPSDPNTLQQEVDDVMAKRLVKYPPGIKCPGSFFKNIVANTLPKNILDKISPEKIVYGKIPAGSLLEEVGAKGQSLNGIEITSYHANLFINNGNGTAKDFHDLAKTYTLKVKEKFGITLEPEVQLINLPSLI